jgi:hypothetical protein
MVGMPDAHAEQQATQAQHQTQHAQYVAMLSMINDACD